MSTDLLVPALFVGGPWDGLVFQVPHKLHQFEKPVVYTARNWDMGPKESPVGLTVFLAPFTSVTAVGPALLKYLTAAAEPHPLQPGLGSHLAGLVEIECRIRVGRDIPWPEDRRKYAGRSYIDAETWETHRHTALSHVTAEIRNEVVRAFTNAPPDN